MLLSAVSAKNSESTISQAVLNNIEGTNRAEGLEPLIVPSWAFCSLNITIAVLSDVGANAAVKALSTVWPPNVMWESEHRATPSAARVVVKAPLKISNADISLVTLAFSAKSLTIFFQEPCILSSKKFFEISTLLAKFTTL